jgi:hypothetical protein
MILASEISFNTIEDDNTISLPILIGVVVIIYILVKAIDRWFN